MRRLGAERGAAPLDAVAAALPHALDDAAPLDAIAAALPHALDDAAPQPQKYTRHPYSGIIRRSRFSSDALLTSVASARIESNTKFPSIHLFLDSTRLMT